ncbi:unnamed protein product [Paramecium pentaurelia]|uniref:C2 domain-containing protein n=1 Tax=Paramecium pentaurelia TaxID=43138 RepID=A0A8S1WLA5_9CILI|nr:unnamed protein product [Paramecium pentaurelia]
MSDSNSHRLKLSIDIHSIKEHSFRGLIYAHYSHYPQIGIKQQFRTAPVIEITKPFVEISFQNSFASYIFDTNKEELQKLFEETQLQIELFHQDRLKKDQFIGISTINLAELLKSPIRKSSKSYARALDAYYPIDDNNDQDTKRIGLLRCICYLEDLGPLDQLQQQEQTAIEQIVGDPALPIISYPNSDDPEKQQVILELHSLEHKVIWELDTWKKSEEAKFRVLLKQKEFELTTKLYQDFKNKELDRERQLKQALTQIQVIENKIKNKGTELLKREQKIQQLEDEVKSKLLETAKIIKVKDEEMGILIKRQKDEKLNLEKEKTLLSLKLADAQAAIQKLEEENKSLKKEIEKSPVAMVKENLQEKVMEITELKKELDRTNQIKEQYKQYYEKMRDELIKEKKQSQDNNSLIQNTLLEFEKVKLELLEVKQKQSINTQTNFQMIKQHMEIYQQEQQQQQQQQIINQPKVEQIQEYNNQSNNPFKNGLIDKSSQKLTFQKNQKSYKNYPNLDNKSDLQRLLQEREYLIESGEYQVDDPLIEELTKQIQQLGGH